VELTGLLWLGALGAILTLIAVAEPARGDTSWAWRMVMAGLVVAAAGAFIQHARRLPIKH
jgi:VIT1/CCC1 family predicted Fe2+/Mn2+ transporter